MLHHFTRPDFRDDSALHQGMANVRGVPEQETAIWEGWVEEMASRDNVPFAPLWAYQPYGILQETPCLPFQTGFAPEPITADDMEEFKLLLHYDAFRYQNA